MLHHTMKVKAKELKVGQVVLRDGVRLELIKVIMTNYGEVMVFWNGPVGMAIWPEGKRVEVCA